MNKILIAEDQPVVMKILNHYLVKSGYDVVSCENGNEAKQRFDTHDFSLVITDILMPEADGLELLHHIRTIRSSSVPVVILTDLISQFKEDEAHRIGASYYVRKPIDIHEFLSVVNFLNHSTITA